MEKEQTPGRISKKSLRKLKGRLPKAFVDKVNEQLSTAGKKHYHRATIYRVLAGENENPDILLALIEVAEQHHKDQLSIKRRLASEVAKKA